MRRVLIAGSLAAVGAALGTRLLRRFRRSDELTSLTKEELYEKAREAEVAGRSEMTKDELIDALARS